ncbi:MAG: hypothetical protein HY343_09085 [Lentisphaerae bacterium]|nr:hypothetical protein [Lentisphaerota bacterium]
MADAEEKSVADEALKDVETRTNTRLRQKYFVEKDKIFSSIQLSADRKERAYSKVIPRRRVTLSKTVVVPTTSAPNALEGDIRVQSIKDGQRTKKLLIHCPCGRHTELNFEYNTESK